MPSKTQRRRQQAATLHLLDKVFDRHALAKVCALPERAFADTYGMTVVEIEKRQRYNSEADFYAFKDNDSSILAVAHLDTVNEPETRSARFVDTEAGPVVFSTALDDRLGAYAILHVLPAMGINVDVLLTTGEEMCQTTAEFFTSAKDYHWVIEFDRGGTDVVLYQYDDEDMRDRVTAAGARVGHGSYSDICALEHLGVKALNWGIGYADYHSERSHAFLADSFAMLAKFADFYATNHDVYLQHDAPELSANTDDFGYWDLDQESRDRLDFMGFSESDWDEAYSRAHVGTLMG